MTEPDDYDEAVAASQLRATLSEAAASAAYNTKIDRTWLNTNLIRLGATPVTGSATYQVNTPITGVIGATIKASSRTEAHAKFTAAIQRTLDTGIIDGTGCVRAFQVAVPDLHDVTFYSGPADVPDDLQPEEMTLAELKEAIVAFFKAAITEHYWGYAYAAHTLDEMGLGTLPALHTKTVDVPVTGFTRISVPVFEGDDDEKIKRAAAAHLAGAKSVYVQPEELGEATWKRPFGTSLGLQLVDDEDDDVAF